MPLFLRTDVTAVRLFNNFVFSGIGSNVYVFDKSTLKLICKEKVLRGQKIYGLVPNKNGKILVYGGKQFAVVSVDDKKEAKILIHLERIICDDWLHDCVWIDDGKIAILTAHNVVQKWDIQIGELLKSYQSCNNSILYSGLLKKLDNDIIVFAGTVFSQVIIHSCENDEKLHELEGHKGVIFSIAWSDKHKILVTTSDDRSVRIWSSNTVNDHDPNTKDYWKNSSFICKGIMYGHLARVLRCTISIKCIISVGEDSHVCFWDFNGKLLRKIKVHDNSPIWSVHSDENSVVTGGGNSGVILHPLSMVDHYGCHDTMKLDFGLPKKVVFTARGNIIVLCENSFLYYYNFESKTWVKICELKHDSTYIWLALSSCKQIVAITDIFGNFDIFTENCKGDAILNHVLNKKLEIGRILSMHWAGNRHLVFCCNNGEISVLAAKGIECEIVDIFFLPRHKERWLTAVGTNETKNIFVLGDRSGNLHFYIKSRKEPIKTFKKIHGKYGPTSLSFDGEYVKTTGRDGRVKYFSVKNCDDKIVIKQLHKVDLPFEWVEKFVDKNETLVCGFQERDFVLFDLENQFEIFKINCGGGHRHWDVIRYYDNCKERVKVIFMKSSVLNIVNFEIDSIFSRNIIKGSHTKEINCLLNYKICIKNQFVKDCFIAGGEDTTIRLSYGETDVNFYDKLIFKHLSSVRTIDFIPLGLNKILLASAGGRAQICFKIVKFKINNEISMESEDVVDYLIKGIDKERKVNQNWKNHTIDFDPETRIMSLKILRHSQNIFYAFAGCSDSMLKVFKLIQNNSENKFEMIANLQFHISCILKVEKINFMDIIILLTATTIGDIALWDFSSIKDDLYELEPINKHKIDKSDVNEPSNFNEVKFSCNAETANVDELESSRENENTNKATEFDKEKKSYKSETANIDQTTPFFTMNTNKAGINSVCTKILSKNQILIATAGDDNAIHVVLLKITLEENVKSVEVTSKWSTSKWHCAQITGLWFVKENYLLSASIDQRITLSRLVMENNEFKYEFVSQNYTDVADIQGMEVIEVDEKSAKVCVYGKGMEVLEIKL